MNKLAIAALTAALAVPTLGHAQDYGRGPEYRRPEITCSSVNGRYHSCRLPERGSARLVHQLSGRACVQGRSWGQSNRGSVWVSRGCRAVFAVRGSHRDGGYDNRVGDNYDHGGNDNGGGYDHGGVNWQRDRNYSVECRSDGPRTVCAWDNRYGNPYMVERMQGDCREGTDWGYDSRGGLWVSSGCSARFGYH
jgi:hypothetical protein